MPGFTKICNGKIITPNRMLEGGTLLISDNRITAISAHDIEVPDAVTIDAGGLYIAPGFIDLHVHGGGGFDFMDNDIDSYLGVANTHVRFGTTAMWPTTLTGTTEGIVQSLRCYEAALDKNTKGAQFIGLHLEGPYFAMNQRGAQDPRYIRNPVADEYEYIISQSRHIKRWSAAPELPGALTFGRFIREKGILPSIAHTDAVYEDAVEAYKEGFTLITHFYSAMNGVTRRNAYRYAGVVEAGYLIEDMDVEIIADGIHLPPPLLQLIYKIKGHEKTALITDAMRGANMPEGNSILGSLEDGLPVIVENGVAKLPDRTSFAGSVATADRLLRTLVKLAGIPLHDAVRMLTETPARIAGIGHQKGSLMAGKDADIVLFDEDIQIKLVMIMGNTIIKANG